MGKPAPSPEYSLRAKFDDHAVAIAKRQYFQPGDNDLAGMFERVASWVAKPEAEEKRESYKLAFFDMMASKRFCPGGRVLAGAATSHGNVLNCFVQDGRPEAEGSTPWVLRLATKLALVTKVGGGNGVCLDPLPARREYERAVGKLYLTVSPSHPDFEKVLDGTFMDLVHGKYTTRGYRFLRFIDFDNKPAGAKVVQVGDSVESIWGDAGKVVQALLEGEDVLVDLSSLRAEGTPVNGSGGTSSGPASFAVEVFDNFGHWASLGGADHAGPVATLRYIFAPTLRAIRQGGTRRGAGMATISITHPDIADFITAKDLARERAEGDISTFNISVLVSDEFMEQAKVQGKEGVLSEIADHAWQTGEPGIIFVDRINDYNPMRETLGEIKATNPCFPADVRIATHRGLVTLGELYRTQEQLIVASDRRVLQEDQPGVTPRAALPVFKTGEAEPVYRVKTQHGYEVRATGNHKFLTPTGWKELLQLRPGEPLLIQSSEGMWSDRYELDVDAVEVEVELATSVGAGSPVKVASRSGISRGEGSRAHMPGEWSRELGAFLGFLVGGGHVSEDEAAITFDNGEFDDLSYYVARFREWFGGVVLEPNGSRQLKFGTAVVQYLGALGLTPAATEQTVPDPVFKAPREAVIGFLQALFSSRGVVDLNFASASCLIQLSSPSATLLRDVQLLLSNLGIVASVRLCEGANGEGGEDFQFRNEGSTPSERFELLLEGCNRDLFSQKIGFLTEEKRRKVREFASVVQPQGGAEKFETVITTVELDAVEAVYDTTEPVAHSVIANGLVAHQCGEIPLFPGEPCDLGAINLAAYVVDGDNGLAGFDRTRFRDDVRTCIRFLDNVLDVNHFALDDNRQMSHYLRRLGLGIMGLADALILMGFRYDSEEGREVVAQMIGELREAATQASEELALERGAFPAFGQSDLERERRNVALLTVAPTGTTSMLMGVSSGVEPIFAPFIYRKIGDSYAALIAPLFKDLLERHDPHPDFRKGDEWDWEKVVEAVQDRHGSVQGLDFIPEEVRSVLVCAHDITPEDHVKMQGVVQRTFDGGNARVANSISKTINMPNKASVEDVYDAYSLAFDIGCKGITVYRDGSRDFQVLSTSSKKEKEESSVSESSDTPASQPSAPPASAAAPSAPVAPSGNGAPMKSPGSPQLSGRLPGEPLFDRPVRVTGFTDKVKLTLSSGEKRGFYVTVNKQDELPTEVFIVSGKAGDESNADSEALGRMVSIALQYGVPAEAIVHTLRGINGGMYGSYQGRMVASKADLIAVALETAGVENTLNKGKGCPDCGAPLRFEEGCMKCESCGYSKCG